MIMDDLLFRGGWGASKLDLGGCVLYLPLWRPSSDMTGSTIYSYDPYRHSCTVTDATWSSTGRTFDGANDIINCGDGTSLDITTAITVEAWSNQSDSTGSRFVVGRDDGTNRSYWLVIGTGQASFILRVGDVSKIETGGTTMATGTWYHITGTYVSGAQSVYVNGVIDSTPLATTGSIDNDNVSLTIGMRPTAEDQDYAGTIGEVRIYNRALGAGEVLHNYQATKWRYL